MEQGTKIRRLYTNLTQFSYLWNPISTPSLSSTRLRNRREPLRTDFQSLIAQLESLPTLESFIKTPISFYLKTETFWMVCAICFHTYTHCIVQMTFCHSVHTKLFTLPFLQQMVCNLHNYVTNFHNSLTFYIQYILKQGSSHSQLSAYISLSHQPLHLWTFPGAYLIVFSSAQISTFKEIIFTWPNFKHRALRSSWSLLTGIFPFLTIQSCLPDKRLLVIKMDHIWPKNKA